MIKTFFTLFFLLNNCSLVLPNIFDERAAFVAYQEGNYKKAQKILAYLQISDSSNMALDYNLGVAAYESADYDTAVKAFRRVYFDGTDDFLRCDAAANAGHSLYRQTIKSLEAIQWRALKKLSPDLCDKFIIALDKALESYDQSLALGRSDSLASPRSMVQSLRAELVARKEQALKEPEKNNSDGQGNDQNDQAGQGDNQENVDDQSGESSKQDQSSANDQSKKQGNNQKKKNQQAEKSKNDQGGDGSESFDDTEQDEKNDQQGDDSKQGGPSKKDSFNKSSPDDNKKSDFDQKDDQAETEAEENSLNEQQSSDPLESKDNEIDDKDAEKEDSSEQENNGSHAQDQGGLQEDGNKNSQGQEDNRSAGELDDKNTDARENVGAAIDDQSLEDGEGAAFGQEEDGEDTSLQNERMKVLAKKLNAGEQKAQQDRIRKMVCGSGNKRNGGALW